MTRMTRYEPWSAVPRLQDEINRLFSSMVDTESTAATVSWVPATDIQEFADRFELYVDLPGVEADRVDLTLEGGVLTICGERSFPAAEVTRADEEEPQFLRTERGQGRFYRRFVLPETVDSENVKANGRNGVLTITIPKQEKAKPRRIEIMS